MNRLFLDLWEEFTKNLKKYIWVVVAVILYLLYFYVFHHDEPNCLVKQITGYPCPGCGMSRALLHLGMFNFETSFMYHPLGFVVPIVIVVFLFKGIGITKKLYESKLFWGIIITLFIGVYVYRMMMYFPNTIPMDYYEGSFLHKLLH